MPKRAVCGGKEDLGLSVFLRMRVQVVADRNKNIVATETIRNQVSP